MPCSFVEFTRANAQQHGRCTCHELRWTGQHQCDSLAEAERVDNRRKEVLELHWAKLQVNDEHKEPDFAVLGSFSQAVPSRGRIFVVNGVALNPLVSQLTLTSCKPSGLQ